MMSTTGKLAPSSVLSAVTRDSRSCKTNGQSADVNFAFRSIIMLHLKTAGALVEVMEPDERVHQAFHRCH